jgi:peptidoglycan hydrolase-like protein with peptidoglycan-binding domain
MDGLTIGIGIALFLALFGGNKKQPSGTVEPGLPSVVKNNSKVAVKLGTARILPTKGKVNVKIGPAKVKPVHAEVPASIHDTTATALQAAQKPGANPIPNTEAARKVAQPVADHVRNNRKKYDHARVAVFQGYAGLKPDGLYGPQTAKALRAYGAKNVVS